MKINELALSVNFGVNSSVCRDYLVF